MLTFKPSYFIGLVFILFGLTLLLNNLGITQVSIGDIISTYWPLILVYWGLSSLSGGLNKERRDRQRILPSERLMGFIVLLVGFLLLGRNLDLFQIDLSLFWNIFWPFILIFFGINLLKGVRGSGGTNWAIMSSIEKINESWQLEDKNYFAIMGGIDLDLSRAQIPDGDTVLVLTAIMGGIDIQVPKEIPIQCEALAFLGGVDFFQDGGGGILMNRSFTNQGDERSRKRIFIRCHTLMGGIEIRESKRVTLAQKD